MAEVVRDLSRVDIVEAGFDAQLGLLSIDEQQALGDRLAGQFGWRAAGDLAVAESTIFTLDRDDYDLTITALRDLGVQGRSKQSVPDFEAMTEVLGSQAVAYLGEHVDRGDKPELTMHIPLTPRSMSLSFEKLIKTFDAKQNYSTWVWEELWGDYNSDEHNGDRGGNVLHAGVMLNDATNPTDREQEANEYNEAGLVYVNQTVPQQRASVEVEAKQAATRGVVLDVATFTEYMVVQAKRRQAGLPLLDKPTVTRFPQYPEKNIDGGVCVPSANVYDGGRLYLYGSDVGDAWGNGGVRRVVRVA